MAAIFSKADFYVSVEMLLGAVYEEIRQFSYLCGLSASFWAVVGRARCFFHDDVCTSSRKRSSDPARIEAASVVARAF